MSATAYDGTAEIWSAKDKMGDSRVLVTMDMSLLGTKLQTSADKTVTVEKDKVKAVNQIFTLVKKAVGDMPLVLHGGTGIPDDQITKAISLGVAKINVNTECQLVFAEATRKYIEEGKDLKGKGFDPRKLLLPGYEAIMAKVEEKMNLFGSVDKA